jgi:cyclopropane-fatty-acyl-phospholipid synthase
MKVNDERVYSALMRGGSFAFGESYMKGWWDSESVDELVYRIFIHNLAHKIRDTPAVLFVFLKSFLLNVGAKSRAFEIGKRHYDIGNNLFEYMLDKRMVYTCGYWRDAHNLDEAQEAKLDLVCKKLGLKAGQKILDIGCGWGSFIKFAAERYKVHAVGITVSKEQASLAKKNCEGLPIEIRLQDYRDIRGTFDHIVSLGMFEHVGYKNYRTYMDILSRSLHNGGLFLLHTIGGNKSVTTTNPWIEKYIFPNSMLPSIAQIGRSIENLFVMEDLENFGAYYDKTLMAWFHNFDEHWSVLKKEYDETFYRMWKFYLLSCAGSFRSRQNQLWQIVLSKNGLSNGYTRP